MKAKPERRYKLPCPTCTYHGQVTAKGVTADVFSDIDHNDGEEDPEGYGVIIIQWNKAGDYDQQDTYSLTHGHEPHPFLSDQHPRLSVGQIEGIPLRELWQKALRLLVNDARAYRSE